MSLPIVDLFNEARKKLVRPTLTVPYQNTKLVFKYATKAAIPAFPALIYITIKKNNVYVGKVNKDGTTKINFSEPSLFETLDKVFNNPLEHSKLMGQQHGNCCFCNLELTNKISLSVGYGPICAEKWGLPWEYSYKEDISNL